jgi:hypothetical protein
MNANHVAWTVAQILNATAVPTVSPCVTHGGLPFGTYASLASPISITGSVTGFGDFSDLTLSYFGFDAANSTWNTGTAWVADVDGSTGSYSAALPAAADNFAAVIMTTSAWYVFEAANPAVNGTITVSQLPSDSGDIPVMFSSVFSPGDGRSLGVNVDFAPAVRSTWTIAPGDALPQHSLTTPINLIENDHNESYTVNGSKVAPTSSEFIQALMLGLPYVPPVHMQPTTPTQGSLRCVTVQGKSLTAGVAGGFFSLMLYQSNDDALYLLLGGAGPNGVLVAQGQQIYSGGWANAPMALVALINVFMDTVTFNVVSATDQFDKNSVDDFVDAAAKIGATISKAIFSVFG